MLIVGYINLRRWYGTVHVPSGRACVWGVAFTCHLQSDYCWDCVVHVRSARHSDESKGRSFKLRFAETLADDINF